MKSKRPTVGISLVIITSVTVAWLEPVQSPDHGHAILGSTHLTRDSEEPR